MRSPQQRRRDANQELSGVRQACSGLLRINSDFALFLPVFKQALLRRGTPSRLFVDNGANYRSQQLALVCARLGVALIHARPFQPQAKECVA